MSADERLSTFIRSLDQPDSELMERLRKQAQKEHVPVIRQEMQSFLQVLLEMKKPKRILEAGTAIGFSACWMAQCTAPGCSIATIEQDENRILQARKNFAASPYYDRITLLEGDAAEILRSLDGPYDVIFMDAAKGQYLSFLPDVLRLLPEGGILISDNILQEGDLLESHYAVERRNRTIDKRMREYLYELKHNEQLVTTIVPLADGVSVSIRRSV